jgi:transcriptional regulator with XRE-family HTH domain
MEAHTFGERLKQAIDRRGFSQGQLEHKTKVLGKKVSQSYVSRLTKDKQNPTWAVAVILARALSVSLDWLAGLPSRTPGELLPDEQELLRLCREELDEGARDILLDLAHTMARKRVRESAPPGE